MCVLLLLALKLIYRVCVCVQISTVKEAFIDISLPIIEERVRHYTDLFFFPIILLISSCLYVCFSPTDFQTLEPSQAV